MVAYEADICDTVLWQKIGKLTMLVRHEGQFVNPQLLARLNNNPEGPSTNMKLKKVRARDPEWLKITKTTNASDEDQQEELEANNRRMMIVSDEEEAGAGVAEEGKANESATVDDERKLRRIAAFK